MSTSNDQFNDDELETPQWLNVELITKILQQYESDEEIVVSQVDFTPATAKGDHYASIMFRASVKYQQHGKALEKSLIIKTMPEVEGHKKDMLKESFIFETEIRMYTEVLPKFEKMLRAAGDETVLGATCIYHSLSPQKFIVFEDLCARGYTVIRDRSFTLDEVKLAYSKIARFHALGYKLCIEQPEYFDFYRHSVMNTDDFVKNEFVQDGIFNFVELLNARPELQQYKAYFEPLRADLLVKVVAAVKEYRDNHQLNIPYVLCHGDFHGKNMMFKLNAETSKAEEIMLLDYQFSYVGSIAMDLVYSFYLLIDAEQRTNHLDELIKFYFDIFLATLQKVGFTGKLPTLNDLQNELKRQHYYEIFLFTSFLPMWMSVRDEGFDINETVSSAEYRKKLYYRQEYIDELKNILPKFINA